MKRAIIILIFLGAIVGSLQIMSIGRVADSKEIVMGGDAKKDTIVLYDALRKENIFIEMVVKSQEEWKKELSSEVYHVTREVGTERPYTGKLLENKEEGIYTCSNCGNHLFDSKTKFESGTGWPSYYEPVSEKNIKYVEDKSLFATRTEIICSRCGAHLGHVFDDGPEPTGKRYCINSLSLVFEKKDNN